MRIEIQDYVFDGKTYWVAAVGGEVVCVAFDSASALSDAVLVLAELKAIKDIPQACLATYLGISTDEDRESHLVAWQIADDVVLLTDGQCSPVGGPMRLSEFEDQFKAGFTKAHVR